MRWARDTVIAWLPDELARHGMGASEQGGLLIGAAGHGWSTVHDFTRPGPMDLQLPGLFMLLDDCHQQQLDASGQSYLGFWHSHPPGTPSEYSPEDLTSWHEIARAMFPQLPDSQTHLLFPIVTGDRTRVWALDRDLTLSELTREEVAYGPAATEPG